MCDDNLDNTNDQDEPIAAAYWERCPECPRSLSVDRDVLLYANVGRDHWAYCDVHKTRWYVGANLFSSWRDETEGDWEANAERLLAYREVEPWLPPRPTPVGDDSQNAGSV